MASKIRLTDDEGISLGITLHATRSGRLLIRGLRVPRTFLGSESAVGWAEDLMVRALEHERNGEPRVWVVARRMGTRDAIRLGFAVRQILLGGPTYFTQEHVGNGLHITDVADYPCPGVALVDPAHDNVGAHGTPVEG